MKLFSMLIKSLLNVMLEPITVLFSRLKIEEGTETDMEHIVYWFF